MPSTKSASRLSSMLTNYLKPHRAEALFRVRINAFLFAVVGLLSYLLPLPPLPTALRIASSVKHFDLWSYEAVCILEVALVSIFGLNILQSAYALRYPRVPPPPTPSKRSIFMSPPAPQRSFKTLSPNTSPQSQKSFSFSPSASTLGLASSTSGTSTYPISPVSTPSRVLRYSIPPPSSSTSTHGSSTSTAALHSTPSPILSAYRGKNSMTASGRALDGSFLSQLSVDDSDDEE